jgi:hypothetical protein
MSTSKKLATRTAKPANKLRTNKTKSTKPAVTTPYKSRRRPKQAFRPLPKIPLIAPEEALDTIDDRSKQIVQNMKDASVSVVALLMPDDSETVEQRRQHAVNALRWMLLTEAKASHIERNSKGVRECLEWMQS